jgi:pilus assembly protein CpaB
MKPKTMILMVVAVACGLGASYMTSKLLADRKQNDDKPTVPVLVAKTRVPGWVAIKEPEKYFDVKLFPQDVAPPKALTEFAEVKDQRLNKYIDEGKPVTHADILTKEQADLAAQLLPGQRAMAIKVNAESLAGGFVLPGTRVDVLCTIRGNDAQAKIFLQNMLVLAVDTQDQRPGADNVKTILGQTVTLAATPEESTRLALASSMGELRLLLKSHSDTRRVHAQVVRGADLDKPLSTRSDAEADAPAPAPAPVAVPTAPIGPVEEEKKVEEPRRPVVEPVRKKKSNLHLMRINNGGNTTKVLFRKGEKEDDEDPNEEETPAKPETPRKDEKADAKPVETPRKVTPTPPTPAPTRTPSLRTPGARGK